MPIHNFWLFAAIGTPAILDVMLGHMHHVMVMPEATGSALYGALFLAGLVGSLTHCAGMCGPFVLTQVSAGLETIPAAKMTEWTRLRGVLLVPYHLGRFTTYVLLGALAAALVRGVAEMAPLRYVAAGLLALAALAFLLQALGRGDLIAGISGLDGDLVRPRWQPEPPNLPTNADGTSKDWCAFGITDRKADFNAFVQHIGDDDGSDSLARHENLTVLTSFYSTSQDNADLNAELLRDGFQIAQNREELQRAQWGLIETGDLTPVPTLVKDRWLYRTDMPLRFRRLILRTYPVLNLLAAQAVLVTDEPPTTTNIEVTNPVTP